MEKIIRIMKDDKDYGIKLPQENFYRKATLKMLRNYFGGEVAEFTDKFFSDPANSAQRYNLVLLTDEELKGLEGKVKEPRGISPRELKSMEADYIASSNNE
jgi:hypothetical protein